MRRVICTGNRLRLPSRSMLSLADVLTLYRCGRTNEAESACEALLAGARADVQALGLLADIQLSTGKSEAAIVNLMALACLQPTDAANQRRLGGALLSAGRAAEAADALRRAVELEPQNLRGHNNLGQALLQMGDTAEAVCEFERALALDPNYAIGHNNLGLGLSASGRHQQAVAAFQRALALDASLGVARLNLAIAYQQLGRLAQALEAYDQFLASAPHTLDALRARAGVLAKLGRADSALEGFDAVLGLCPEDAPSLASKASVLMSTGRADEALSAVEHALRLRPDFVEALNVRAGVLCMLNRPAEALHSIEEALQLDSRYVEGWCTSALIHRQLGDHGAALAACRRALSLDPDSMRARTGSLSAWIPSVPDSAIADSQARTEFERELGAFERWLDERELDEADAWTMATQPLFYLSYQPELNKTLLQRYRGASARRLAAFVPEEQRPPALGASRRRLRLGIVSAHVFDHSVFSAIVHGWLAQLGREEFEITLFSLGTIQDATTAEARRLAECFESGARSASDWARLIQKRGCDALIFPEIGMDPTTLALAHLRLASRQFASWGHPDTTGLATIDGYLSAQAFEPPNAHDHYGETLIPLPNLGVYYRPHATAPAQVDFARLGVADDAAIFVCPGTPFKYRPQDDLIFVEIARRVGRCTFVFFNHDKIELSRRLGVRLTAAFAAAGLNARDHLAWIPWLPRSEFLGLLRQSDVYLDTIGFSGFNTMMQAVGVDLPCVAYEGRYMRGRLGSGILKHLGMPELVAATPAQYVEIAVRLAESTSARAVARDRLKVNKHRAYEDTSAVHALARVLALSLASSR